MAGEINYEYSEHGVLASDLVTLVGRVRSIRALHYDSHEVVDGPSPGTTLVPSPGTGRLTEIQSDLRWELEPKDSRQEVFGGWIAEVEVTALEPVEFEEVQQYRPRLVDDAMRWFRRRRGLHRICCLLTMRLLMTWLTVDSTVNQVMTLRNIGTESHRFGIRVLAAIGFCPLTATSPAAAPHWPTG